MRNSSVRSDELVQLCLRVFGHFLLSMNKTLSPTHAPVALTNHSASFNDCTCDSESGAACLPRWRFNTGGAGDGTTASGVDSGPFGHLLFSFIGVFFVSSSLGLLAASFS